MECSTLGRVILVTQRTHGVPVLRGTHTSALLVMRKYGIRAAPGFDQRPKWAAGNKTDMSLAPFLAKGHRAVVDELLANHTVDPQALATRQAISQWLTFLRMADVRSMQPEADDEGQARSRRKETKTDGMACVENIVCPRSSPLPPKREHTDKQVYKRYDTDAGDYTPPRPLPESYVSAGQAAYQPEPVARIETVFGPRVMPTSTPGLSMTTIVLAAQEWARCLIAAPREPTRATLATTSVATCKDIAFAAISSSDP